MADLVNPTVLTTGNGMMGGGYNGGFGNEFGGGIGALLIGALLFGGGLGGFGNRAATAAAIDGDFVTQTSLQTALNQQSQNFNTNQILQTLASIQASIPENEGKVQLAVAQAQNAIQGSAAQNATLILQQSGNLASVIENAEIGVKDSLSAGFTASSAEFNNRAEQITAQITGGLAATIASITAANANIKDAIGNVGGAVASFGSSLALGQANSNSLLQSLASGLSLQGAQQTAALATAVRDDGERTRSLIIAQNDTFLNRIITEQANALVELRNERHATNQGITLQQTVNQAQAQNQAQQQQQQQFQILGQIAAALTGLTQIAHATNQNVIAGNTGAVTTGAQNANPVNVA